MHEISTKVKNTLLGRAALGIVAIGILLDGCGGNSSSAGPPVTPPAPPTQPILVSAPHAPIRARYLRTNSFYDPNALGFAPPHFTVYDAVHRRFYVSNPYMNEIDVFDAVHEAEIARIPVPGAWGIDLSPVGATLYAGTLAGDVYQINTQTDQVVQRFTSSSIGPNGFDALQVFVLADGRLALGGGGGVDGFRSIGVWDPSTNVLDLGPTPSSPLIPPSVCPNLMNVGALAVSGDRTRVLASSIASGGGGVPVCSYDPTTHQVATGTYPSTTPVREIIPSPDGSRFFLTSNSDGVLIFDAKTAQFLGQITQPAGPNSALPNGPSGAVLSTDGRTLYLVDPMTSAIAAYDTTSYKLKGWVPSFYIADGQSGPVIAAIDDTGLIVGPTGHGVDFLDASHLFSTPPPVLQLAYVTPISGSESGGTVVTSNVFGKMEAPPVVQHVYFGNSQGVNPSYNNPLIHSTTPPSSISGAVDLTLLLNDGAIGFAPEGFSYGPTILEVVANAATAEGGQLGSIVGYGFGHSPNDVQVSIGGHPAQVIALYPQAPISPYPFPIESLQFTVPPGVAGSAADVTVTTSSGTATDQDGFHYVAAVSSYPGSTTLQSGIYDSIRDLYYFADKSQIQVFSKTTGTWLPPISLPGVTAQTQLRAISESPDGSKLAVSDFGGQAIYVLDPDTPGTAHSYPMPFAPAGLAITNDGAVYFAGGNAILNKLITSTGTITDIGFGGSGGSVRVLLSPDGRCIYSHVENATFWVDTSNDSIHYSRIASLSGGFHDVAISSDGSTVASDSWIYDSSLNPEIPSAYIDWETWLPTAIPGEKLNSDGSILFQPLSTGFDMIARNTGQLLYRLQSATAPANVYDALFNTGDPNSIGIITSNGIAFVDLSSLPVPTEDQRPFPNSSRTEMPTPFNWQKSSLPKQCSTQCIESNLRPRLKKANQLPYPAHR